jgi:hypothetical protein
MDLANGIKFEPDAWYGERWLTIQGINGVREAFAAGTLKGVRTGANLAFKGSDLQAWLDAGAPTRLVPAGGAAAHDRPRGGRPAQSDASLTNRAIVRPTGWVTFHPSQPAAAATPISRAGSPAVPVSSPSQSTRNQTMANVTTTDSDIQRFEQLVLAYMDQGLSKADATKAVVRKHPVAHRAYVVAYNAKLGRQVRDPRFA